MKKTISKEHLAVLQRIQSSIPKEWLDTVTTRAPLAPTIIEIMRRGLEDPDVPEETKRRFRLILDGKFLEKEVELENSDVTDKIDKFVDEEIEKAVLRGELPNKMLKNIKRYYKAKYG
jgi:hypothetical protein